MSTSATRGPGIWPMLSPLMSAKTYRKNNAAPVGAAGQSSEAQHKAVSAAQMQPAIKRGLLISSAVLEGICFPNKIERNRNIPMNPNKPIPMAALTISIVPPPFFQYTPNCAQVKR